MSPREPEATRAIYVRIPLPEAEKLDRAAERLRASKREVIATLLSDHLDPEHDEVFIRHVDATRRVVVEDRPDGLAVGHASFAPTEPQEVLTLEEAADLLRVTPEALRARAEAGEVPGRRLGEDWRFRREALLEWLAAA